MKALLKVLGAVVVAALVLVGAGALLEQAGVETPLTQAKNSAANAALDASGLKEKADAALRGNIDAIARKTGLPASAVESAIDSLDITSWEVTSLPAGATPTGTSAVDYDGMAATVTTYDDPAVVTVNSNGMDVTLAVPPSAQGYIRYLGYL